MDTYLIGHAIFIFVTMVIGSLFFSVIFFFSLCHPLLCRRARRQQREKESLPGGTVGYPAPPRFIGLSVCESICRYVLIILQKIY